MMRASKEFNLILDDGFADDFGEMGIWDGNKFVLVVSSTRPSRLATKVNV